MKGKLFLVSTPIGNLGDITLRAREVLKREEYIACEDTRVASRLLKGLGINDNKMLISYFEQNEEIRIPNLINILKNGKNLVLISDSGTPGISDPGFRLTREAISEGIKVEPVPGASAVLASLVASGLPSDKFLFLGFLPLKSGNRKKILLNTKESLELIQASVIFYEAPHKIVKTLEDLEIVFGNIEIVIARELTKIHEEIKKDKVSNFIEVFKTKKPKGELTILFSPKDF